MKNFYYFFLLLFMFTTVITKADEPDSSATLQDVISSLGLNSVNISGQVFFRYQNGQTSGETINQFNIKRGYITIKNKFNDVLSARFTQDITLDEEGDGKGDIELRLKYAYLQFNLGSFWIFTKPYIEAGVIHTPWIDFEQKINDYRVQGQMYLETVGIMSSSDYGVMITSLLGGEMSKSYKKNVNKKFAGKYGSVAVGVYNGGGYHALEYNKDKPIQWRLSLRPLHKIIPGLQFHYTGIYGKGNIPEEPKWESNSGIVSFESKILRATGTYFTSTGDRKAKQVDSLFNAYKQNGYSVFTELKLPYKFSLWGRYDYSEVEKSSNITRKRSIIGIAYRFLKNSKILIDYDRIEYSDTDRIDNLFEAALEFRF